MKYKLFALCAFLFAALKPFAQDTAMKNLHNQIEKDHKSIAEQIEETKRINASMDSSMAAYTKTMSESQRRRDSINMDRNMSYFLAEQRARKAKEQKTWLLTRGMMAVGLILAAIGIARQKKRAKAKKEAEANNKPV